MKIFDSFKTVLKSEQQKNSDNTVAAGPNADNLVKITRNWYEDRADKLIIQRNVLLILSLLLVILTIVSVFAVIFVVNSKEYDPFVIQIDNTTGVTSVVNPMSSEILNGDEALSRYFLKKYVIARETYNPVDFDSLARKTVRLFSSSSVYYTYLSYIKNKNLDPSIKYAQQNTTFLIVKSWSKVASDKYMLRFSINETDGDKKVYDKIAVVSFAYKPMQLNDDERDINPVGFQVIGYRVDDDNS